MLEKIRIAALFLIITPLWAADSNSPVSGSAPSDTSPAASVQSPIPGPFQEDRKLPVNPKQVNPETKAETLDKEIKRIEKALLSKRLSPAKREALERKRGELNAERMSLPTDTPPARQ